MIMIVKRREEKRRGERKRETEVNCLAGGAVLSLARLGRSVLRRLLVVMMKVRSSLGRGRGRKELDREVVILFSFWGKW